jgi:cyclopropane fatty-acyl-phospholipid synthase-like methyltransferase
VTARRRRTWAALGGAVLVIAAIAAFVAERELRQPDVGYVPTEPDIVDAMLDLARLTPSDVLYDLGCGDGRIVVAAAKRGAYAVGIDIDPQRIAEANANANAAGVSDRVQFLQEDLFSADISRATVVAVYLLPSLNLQLRPRLFKELRPGTRVVSHSFDMGDWQPEQTLRLGDTRLFLWRIQPDRSM